MVGAAWVRFNKPLYSSNALHRETSESTQPWVRFSSRFNALRTASHPQEETLTPRYRRKSSVTEPHDKRWGIRTR